MRVQIDMNPSMKATIQRKASDDLTLFQKLKIRTKVWLFILHTKMIDDAVVHNSSIFKNSIKNIEEQCNSEFEHQQNELYFPVKNELQYGSTLKIVQRVLTNAVIRKFHQKNMCILYSIDNGCFPSITVWFFTLRNDGIYLDSNLNEYLQPVMVQKVLWD